MKMIVGLGNPGKEYEGTRHNAGFEVLDIFSGRVGIEVRRKKFGGLVGEGMYRDDKLILLKPMSYMNRSGQVLATAAGFYKLGLEDLLVVVDDMALEVGRIRFRSQGSSGGQKGLGDIIMKLGSEEFCRLRVGIGSGRGDAVNHVLSRISSGEREEHERAKSRAAEGIFCWLDSGITEAMSRFNGNEE